MPRNDQDQDRNEDDADQTPRRRDRNTEARSEGGAGNRTTESRPSAAAKIDVTLEGVTVEGETQKALFLAKCTRGQEVLVGSVQFFVNGNAEGEPRPTMSGSGIATYLFERLPLTESAITVKAVLLNTTFMGMNSFIIPAAPKKESGVTRIRVADWKVISDYDSECGRWALLVEIYDPTALYVAGIPITLMDAQQNPPFFEPQNADPHTRVESNNARILPPTLLEGAQNASPNPWLTDQWGRFRYWLDGINLRPGERRDIYVSSPFLEGVKTIVFVGMKPKDPAPLPPPERQPGDSWWATQRAEWDRARGRNS